MDNEQICQKGSASLLMPSESFLPRAKDLGLFFQSAESLANEYEVSLMAALCRLLDMYPNKGMLVLWQLKNKPTEIKKEVPIVQIPLPGFQLTGLPAPKFRVTWVYGDYKNYYMPLNKSIPEEFSVYDAWKNNQFASDEEMIPFGSLSSKSIYRKQTYKN